MHRTKEAGDFAASDIARLQYIIPFLHQALAVHERLVAAEGARQTALAALDQLASPVILADAEARVLHANAAAEILLGLGDGLRRGRGGELTADRPDQNRKLRDLIAAAAPLSQGAPITQAGGAVAVSRARSTRPLAVMVAPLPVGHINTWNGRGVVALFISDPDAVPTPPEELLTVMFGLTGAEAKAAILIAAGMTPDEAAGHLSVAVATVRSHLKSTFAKTGASRQAELASLIVRLSAVC